ncbi:16S rRNA (uracil(1498)-N(3))-methyltransferase [Ginsengibacter hankyongi]|uniref:Ribosomal RNA small subunit methyltransferase E n=1 Tax=Ginsengibacter hankyongi TaxID=2607284 RepID=A0A5J5INS9_9BACT|nr:RsmE family RNA methyltransferase [Ginsengibacter hankyongi]KAA9041584.1 16S rRNA (uracil(1498)-N(3))-methyltransferase [Ginsengibacter hankyongi]
MELPFFFEENLPVEGNFILKEETSKHIVQVLRMHENENLLITNGKGQLLTATVINANKKNAEVQIINKADRPKHSARVSIGISLIKNTNRFEWFLEKATEIGVSEIIPLICERTEKQHLRYDRMKNIIVSAMLQSQQAWLPVLHEPVKFNTIINDTRHQNKFIAHCVDDGKQRFSDRVVSKEDQLILIGPEGDFTADEISNAIQNNYIPVSLGETRLRTETAGIVAAVLLLNR